MDRVEPTLEIVRQVLRAYPDACPLLEYIVRGIGSARGTPNFFGRTSYEAEWQGNRLTIWDIDLKRRRKAEKH